MMHTTVSYQSEASRSEVNGVSILTGLPLTTTPSVLTDNGRRAINLNASTDLSEMLTFNLTGSHVVNFDRNFNRQLSNLIFSAVLQLRFFAGELR
jgi:hypothetical protein